uniref:F-box domain-containing protein n=1 Tax=Meloidogyne hapla TaxID=6305 RepID=A0A1I8BXL7_MELHA
MNLNKKQQQKTLPNELLFDIFKSLNISLNELELNELVIESTTTIFKQLKKYSKNLLISSKILNIIVGEAFKKRKITAILFLTIIKSKKKFFVEENLNDLTTRVNELEILLNQSIFENNEEIRELRTSLNELRTFCTQTFNELKNKISKGRNILFIFTFLHFSFICFYIYCKIYNI